MYAISKNAGKVVNKAMPKTLIERGLEAHRAIERFAKAMEAEYPAGKEVQFKFVGRPVMTGKVSVNQYPPADAILGGLLVDVPDDIADQCPIYATNKRYGHVNVSWSHLYFAEQEQQR